MEAKTENPGQPQTPEGEGPLPGSKEAKPRPARKRTRKVKVQAGEALVIPRPRKMSSGRSVKPEENIERKKKVIAEWAALRAMNPKLSIREGAAQLNMNSSTLWNYIRQGTKEGWLKFDDPMERLEHEIIPGVVDNLAGFIAAKDRTVTIEAAKGTIFKTYQEKMGIADTAQRPVLALHIEITNPDNKPLDILEGQIIGKPKELPENVS